MAGRPATPIGTWGEIRITTLPSGKYQAHARARTFTGDYKRVTATATSKGAARNRLLERLGKIVDEAASAGGITPDMTIAELVNIWIEQKNDVSDQTLGQYQVTIKNHINPLIGSVRLRESTPGRMNTYLESLAPGTRHHVKNVLVQAFRLAKSHDAVTSNPLEGARQRTNGRNKTPVRALTPEELAELRAGTKAWELGEIDDDGHAVPEDKQQPKPPGLNWFVDLLLATGARTGEIAAAQWYAVDLEAEPPTILIDATMVMVAGEGLRRQETTKSRQGRRLTLPPFAVQTLAEMRQERPESVGADPLFPSTTGWHRDPNNIRKEWRAARRAAGGDNPDKWEWVQFRTMRKTVATLIDRVSSDQDAAAQLGHAGTAVTHKHYIAAKDAVAPDLSEILERFAGARTAEGSGRGR